MMGVPRDERPQGLFADIAGQRELLILMMANP